MSGKQPTEVGETYFSPSALVNALNPMEKASQSFQKYFLATWVLLPI
jgi:hypothetical protein